LGEQRDRQALLRSVLTPITARQLRDRGPAASRAYRRVVIPLHDGA